MAIVKNKGGRPRKTLTTDQINEVEILARVLSIEHIADYLGISKNTFYGIMKNQPEVYERYKSGKAKAIFKIGNSLIQDALNGNVAAKMFYLKTQAGWRETANLNIGENKDSPLKITISPVDAIKPMLIESGKDES